MTGFACLFLVVVYPGWSDQQGGPVATQDGAESTGWLIIGDFRGSTKAGLVSRASNWLFQYERDDNLFRDLGDLGVGIGVDWGGVDIDWDIYFRRRVISDHEVIEGEKHAVTITTNYSNQYARQEEVHALGEAMRQILDLSAPNPAVKEIEDYLVEATTELSLDLVLSFGPQEAAELEQATADEIWTELAEILLGTELRDAWSTESKRYWWQPGAPTYIQVDPSVRHVTLHYDRLRGYSMPSQKSKIFRSAEHPSAKLFRIARKTVKKIERLKMLVNEKPDCLKCLVKGYSSGLDVQLIQALLVRFGGGVEAGGVGYEFLAGNMGTPNRGTNNVLHGYHTARSVDETVDAPSLRAQKWDRPFLRGYGDLKSNRLESGVVSPFGSELERTRFYYDIPVEPVFEIDPKKKISVLVRILNDAGRPVTEEQQILMVLPEGWQEMVPRACIGDKLEELVDTSGT